MTLPRVIAAALLLASCAGRTGNLSEGATVADGFLRGIELGEPSRLMFISRRGTEYAIACTRQCSKVLEDPGAWMGQSVRVRVRINTTPGRPRYELVGLRQIRG